MADNTGMTWETLRGRRAIVPQHVVHRALPHETVLLNVSTSTYHAIDEVGARFLEVVTQAPSVEAATTALAGEYEQPVERIRTDMVAFCSDLAERDLIELRDA